MADQSVYFPVNDDNESQCYLAPLSIKNMWSVGGGTLSLNWTETLWLNRHKTKLFTETCATLYAIWAGSIGHVDLWTHSDHQLEFLFPELYLQSCEYYNLCIWWGPGSWNSFIRDLVLVSLTDHWFYATSRVWAIEKSGAAPKWRMWVYKVLLH